MNSEMQAHISWEVCALFFALGGFIGVFLIVFLGKAG